MVNLFYGGDVMFLFLGKDFSNFIGYFCFFLVFYVIYLNKDLLVLCFFIDVLDYF